MSVDEKVQVVILSGGKGTRFLPLTENVPKVLVEVGDKSVLEWKLEVVSKFASEIILVVGYLKEAIISKYGDEFNGVPIKYVEQKEQLGTGHALMCASEFLDSKFMVLNGDDIYLGEDLLKLSMCEFGMLGMEVEDARSFGVLEIDNDDSLIRIVEKPERPPSNLVNIGAYMFTPDIFDFELRLSARGEYELVDYLNFLKGVGQRVNVIATDFWLPVGNFDELKVAEEILKERGFKL